MNTRAIKRAACVLEGTVASILSRVPQLKQISQITTSAMTGEERPNSRCEPGTKTTEEVFGTAEFLASFDEFQALFHELDQKYFAGRLIGARYRAEQRKLDKVCGAQEYYLGLDGDMHATALEEGILGKCVEAQHVIFVGFHDVRNTLLHEMCHAIVDLDRPLPKGADKHGRRFVHQLQRIGHVDYAQYALRLRTPASFRGQLPEMTGNGSSPVATLFDPLTL
jgi:hypothetical protein